MTTMTDAELDVIHAASAALPPPQRRAFCQMMTGRLANLPRARPRHPPQGSSPTARSTSSTQAQSPQKCVKIFTRENVPKNLSPFIEIEASVPDSWDNARALPTVTTAAEDSESKMGQEGPNIPTRFHEEAH